MSKDRIGVHGYKVMCGKTSVKPGPKGRRAGLPPSTVIKEIEITDVRVRTCFGRVEVHVYSGGMWVPIVDCPHTSLPFNSVITARDIYQRREDMLPKIGKR